MGDGRDKSNENDLRHGRRETARIKYTLHTDQTIAIRKQRRLYLAFCPLDVIRLDVLLVDVHLVCSSGNDGVSLLSCDSAEDDVHLLERDTLSLGNVQIGEHRRYDIDSGKEEELGGQSMTNGVKIYSRFHLC